VVSFDESEALDFFYSPVTFVDQNTGIIAKEAVNILMKELNRSNNTTEKTKQVKKIIDAKLVIRKSSQKLIGAK
jgi:LacI family transcriptional regulator